MDKKYFITILVVYVTLDVVKGFEIPHFWIPNQLFKLVVCLVVFFLFALIWSGITKDKF